MLPRTVLTALGGLLIGGCAIPAEPRFGNNHPASPQASEAPMTPVSQTLAADNPAAPVMGAMPKAAGEEMGHGHMSHGDMPGMKHDEHDMPAMQHGTPGTQPASTTQKSTAAFTCVMHPEITSDAPGKCPKCGMKLLAKKK